VLEEIASFAVFGLLDRIRFLVRLAFEAQWIAETAVFQLPYLAMLPVILAGIGARSGVESAYLQSCFAQELHRRAAACAGAYHDHIKDFVGQ